MQKGHKEVKITIGTPQSSAVHPISDSKRIHHKRDGEQEQEKQEEDMLRFEMDIVVCKTFLVVTI